MSTEKALLMLALYGCVVMAGVYGTQHLKDTPPNLVSIFTTLNK